MYKKTLPHLMIIGAGSIGQLYYHFITRSKLFQTSFCDPRLSYPKKVSLQLNCHTKPPILPKKTYFFAKITPKTSIKYADIILITTKAYQLKEVGKQIKPYLKPKSIIIDMCNGYGAQQELKKMLPNNLVFHASTTNGAFHKKFTLFFKGLGTTFIEKTPTTQKLLHKLKLAIPNSVFSSNIDKVLLKKLAINAMINPLTVKYQCTNGKLLEHLTELHDLATEISLVFHLLRYPLSAKDLLDLTLEVIQKTRENYSSMYQDYRYNRKTELDNILGIFIIKAKELNISLPHINNLYHLLHKD